MSDCALSTRTHYETPLYNLEIDKECKHEELNAILSLIIYMLYALILVHVCISIPRTSFHW